uniref:Uncharacterized protein n=1 Tax=Trichogramma kaykai TaxID=54128 RepID=A0ABD2XHC2_9HYME
MQMTCSGIKNIALGKILHSRVPPHAPAPLLLLQLTNAVVSLFYLICRTVPSEKARRAYIRARDRFPVVLQEQRRLLLITDIALAKLGKSVWPVPRGDLLGIPNHQFVRGHIDEGTRVGTRDANARCNQRQLMSFTSCSKQIIIKENGAYKIYLIKYTSYNVIVHQIVSVVISEELATICCR